MEVEMKIRGLMMDPVTNMPIVVLKDVGSDTVLPIWVGVYEANAIALEIEKVTTPRPITHDLIKNRLISLDTHVPKPVALLQPVLLRQLNVSQTEDAARAINEGIKAKKAADKSPEIRTLETDLQHLLGTKVELRTGKQNRGSLVIHYYSLDDFDRILEKLKSAYK